MKHPNKNESTHGSPLPSTLDASAPPVLRGRRLSLDPPGEGSGAWRGAASALHLTPRAGARAGDRAREDRRAASNDDLVLACQQEGDHASFAELYRRHQAFILRICLRVTGNVQDAEDAAQDTFLTVYQKLSTFRFQSRFSSWIFRVAYNKGVELHRMRQRTDPYYRGCDASDPTGGLDAIEDSRQPAIMARLVETEGCERITRAIHDLSPGLRKAAALRYLDELSYKEIGQRLSVPIGTVRSRLSRARESVRESVRVAHAG